MVSRYSFQFHAMGTCCELQLYGNSLSQARQVKDLVVADVMRLEKKYSRYREDSFLSQINRCAQSGGSIEVDEETAALINYADTCYRESDGLFDISSGVLGKLWRAEPGKGLPDAASVTATLATVGWQKIDWSEPVLTFAVPGMALDLGGIVKEYAADRSCTLCKEHGIAHGLINLGGDIAVIGPHVNGEPWQIAIRHPTKADASLAILLLSSGALASSGDYERFLIIDGQRYGHIINPLTGWPTRDLVAVSVQADFCLVAGSAATIAMLKENKGKRWLRELGLKHLWMDARGRSFCSR